MPKLQHDAPALAVHCLGHRPPRGHLLIRVNARRPAIALGLRADVRGLRNDQAGPRALLVVERRQRAGNVAGVDRAQSRERRHPDAVGEGQRADLQRFKEDVVHLGFVRNQKEKRLLSRWPQGLALEG